MSKPILYIFAISHFCEKARWALDYYGIDYDLRYLAPGIHMKVAKSLGLKRGSVPILQSDEMIIQGSGDIMTWAESIVISNRSLLPHDATAAASMEARIDSVLGVHVRRYYYSEALVKQPESVLPIFLDRLSFMHKMVTKIAWKKIQTLMITAMDLGLEQGQESKAIISDELDWLDERLADGREFLHGDQLGRLDIATASILSPLIVPAEHPTYANLEIPSGLEEDIAVWKKRPSLVWADNMYNQYRNREDV